MLSGWQVERQEVEISQSWSLCSDCLTFGKCWETVSQSQSLQKRKADSWNRMSLNNDHKSTTSWKKFKSSPNKWQILLHTSHKILKSLLFPVQKLAENCSFQFTEVFDHPEGIANTLTIEFSGKWKHGRC